MEVGVEAAEHRVCADVVGEHAQRVGVNIERVGTVVLREVAGQCMSRGEGFARLFVVAGIVGREQVLVLRVQAACVADGLHGPREFVVDERVALHGPFVVEGLRAVEQSHELRFGVVEAVFGVDAVCARVDVRLPDHFGPFRLRVVVEGVGQQSEAGSGEFHVVVERSLSRVRVVFAPVRRELVVAVGELSALEVVARVVEAVVVEAVGLELLLSVRKRHVLPHLRDLRFAVVVEPVARERERVGLVEPHVSEGVEGLREFVEQGAVAVHHHARVFEHHVAAQALRAVHHPLVEAEVVGVAECDAFAGGRARLLGGLGRV